MKLEQFSANLHLFIAVISLVFLWFCWRSYRVDALRETLFAIRQELFDFAATEGVPFDHKAYTLLRWRLNGMIRFAHRISFARLACSIVYLRLSDHEALVNPKNEWRAAVSSLEGGARRTLVELENHMAQSVVQHMFLGSPFMIGICALILPIAFVTGLAMRLWQVLTRLTPGLDTLEAQALVEQQAKC